MRPLEKQSTQITQERDSPLSLVFSPDGKRLVSTSFDKTIKVWDTSTGDRVLTLKGHCDYVECVAFNSDGTRLVSGGRDKVIMVWEASLGQELMTLRGHPYGIESVMFNSSDQSIFSQGDYGDLRLWNASSKQRIVSFKEHRIPIAFSPDGKLLACKETNNSMGPLDPSSGKDVLELTRMVRGSSVWYSTRDLGSGL